MLSGEMWRVAWR